MYKLLGPNDKSIKPFEVHKTFTFTNADSGSLVYGLEGLSGSLHNFTTSSAASQSFGVYNSLSASLGHDAYSLGTFYKLPLFFSIKHLYYTDVDIPLHNFGGNNTSTEKRELHNRCNVITVPKDFFGNSIKKGSIELTDNSTASTLVLNDDGHGNMYDYQYSSSYANYYNNGFDSAYLTSEGSGSVLGNVFYQHGLIVLTNTGSMYAGVGLGTGSDGFSLSLKSSIDIYEHEYICTINPNEYTHTTNISMAVARSGSLYMPVGSNVSASNFFPPGDSAGYATSYNPGEYYINEVTHSEWSSYVTQVGLYNDNDELLAIGKLSHALKNDPDLALSIVVRFDA